MIELFIISAMSRENPNKNINSEKMITFDTLYRNLPDCHSAVLDSIKDYVLIETENNNLPDLAIIVESDNNVSYHDKENGIEFIFEFIKVEDIG